MFFAQVWSAVPFSISMMGQIMLHFKTASSYSGEKNEMSSNLHICQCYAELCQYINQQTQFYLLYSKRECTVLWFNSTI